MSLSSLNGFSHCRCKHHPWNHSEHVASRGESTDLLSFVAFAGVSTRGRSCNTTAWVLALLASAKKQKNPEWQRGGRRRLDTDSPYQSNFPQGRHPNLKLLQSFCPSMASNCSIHQWREHRKCYPTIPKCHFHPTPVCWQESGGMLWHFFLRICDMPWMQSNEAAPATVLPMVNAGVVIERNMQSG